MPESIEIGLKRSAIALAEELNYLRAAERLNITHTVLRKQISTLEKHLCLHIFRRNQRRVELTDEGKFLIRAFRDSVALHDRRISDATQEKQDEKESV